MKRYCYRKPEFPDRAFAAILIYMNDKGIQFGYPLSSFFTSFDDLRSVALDVIESNKSLSTNIAEETFILPAIFERTWQLKREYWANPNTEYTSMERMKKFIEAVKNYELYKLLVTPAYIKKNNTILCATLPFPVSAPDKTIDQFMLHSDYPVDSSASHAAIYTFEQPYGMNWKTGEIYKRPGNQPN